uniref:NusG-like N-terminal domain-containing protein n=1 Tax=Ananas comosus var. bracteatus TaxID=296719 RepID=A0A6V7NUL6_ANACO|nr:unnamed protein product [Ananas comosus var. bracteatus]
MKHSTLLLQWRSPPLPCLRPLSLPTRSPSSSLSPPPPLSPPLTTFSLGGGGGGGGGGELTARERRQLRHERRESRAGSANWREEVEERLLHKPKKKPRASWTEELNLDLLARLGPRWWVVRVSRATGHETAERLARALARGFPDLEFKVYYPSVREKRKLKNGSISIKSKPLFPGCVFLHCTLNKEIHDFIRECDGIGGFIGSRVGNTKRQINKPKPVEVDEMEAVFKQAKEEQQKADQAFEEEEQGEHVNIRESIKLKDKMISRLKKETSNSGKGHKSLIPGVPVRVLSGPFTEFTGRLKELDLKNGKATVGFMLFGKESFVDLEIDQVDAANT